MRPALLKPDFTFVPSDLDEYLQRPEERRAIFLREGGKSFKEIGADLGITNNGAHRLYKAGLFRLKAGLTAAGKLTLLSATPSGPEIPKGDALLEASKEILNAFPTMGWVPNTAQRRMLAPWEKPPYPFIQVNSCGNGAGKTNIIPQDIVGCLCGPEYLNDCWNRDWYGNKVGMTHYQYYHDCARLRETGQFKYRILCDAEDMKDGKRLCSEIKKYIPFAEFKLKNSTGSWRQIHIPLPSNPEVKNIIDVLTFEQELTAHAGETVNRVAINEPPNSYEVFKETVARTRSEAGELQGTVVIWATILRQAVWLWELENDEDFQNVVFVQGSTWENCVGNEITDEIAEKLKEKIGVVLDKDENGNYITYGRLSRQSVENQIKVYEKGDPNEIDARVWGANTMCFGSEFKSFNVNVHMVPTKPAPKRYPVIQIVDPHDGRPDLSAWAYFDPMMKLHFFEEWPHDSWEKHRYRQKTIEKTCSEWDFIETSLGFKEQIVCRIGDPNKFQTPSSRDNLRLWMMYVPHGFSFNIFVNDSIEYGHTLIHSRLDYDRKVWEEEPNDVLARPSLDFTENCKNLKNSCKYYGRKEQKDTFAAPSEQIEKKWKGGMDIIRYACVWAHAKTFGQIMEMMTGQDDFFAKVQRRREGNYEEGPIPASKLKGRKLLTVLHGR